VFSKVNAVESNRKAKVGERFPKRHDFALEQQCSITIISYNSALAYIKGKSSLSSPRLGNFQKLLGMLRALGQDDSVISVEEIV